MDRKLDEQVAIEKSLLVNLAFDTYLELGSIKDTADTLNRLGYRSKSYISRQGKYHPVKEFSTSTMQGILKNVAYFGKKNIVIGAEPGEERRLMDAV